MASISGSASRILALMGRFGCDQSGKYAVAAVFVMPALVGVAGFGAEYGLWVYKYRTMLSAAGAAAEDAAAAGSNIAFRANAITASTGFANGANGTTVIVNHPPLSGSQVNNRAAVEVIVEQPQPRLLSRFFDESPVLLQARAVAVPVPGTGCVLALNANASGAVALKEGATVRLNGCSLYDNSSSSSAMSSHGILAAQSVNVVGRITGVTSGITAPNGIHTGIRPVSDPYADVPAPAVPPGGCYNIRSRKTVTLSEGYYCEFNISDGDKYRLNPGTYYIGGLRVSGGGELTGRNVTLVFTPGAWAAVDPDAQVDLTAPAAGPTAGIVMFGDRNMAAGASFKLDGGSEQKIGGAIYLPKAAVSFSGAAHSDMPCQQVIADTISFGGNSDLQFNCAGVGTKPLGPVTARSVE